MGDSIQYYVSINGNDNWSGQVPAYKGHNDGPFRTIEKARRRVRNLIKQGLKSKITVFIRGGEYYLKNPLVFNKDDGSEYNITYINYPGEVPVVSGGKKIVKWKKYNEKIYMAEVGNSIIFNTIYENSIRGYKARYPVKGYNRVAGMVKESSKYKFKFGNGDIPELKKGINNLQVFIWPGGKEGDRNWYSNTIDINKLDYKNKIISLNKKASYELGPGSRYYIQGALELISAEGEFYFDSQKGILYYWPRKLPIEDQEIVIPAMNRIIEFKGINRDEPVKNICLDGLTIKHSDVDKEIVDVKTQDCQGLTGGINLENATGIEIKNCHINNIGLHGIYLKGLTTKNKIYGNLIEHIGHTGVQIEGIAEVDCYINKENVISNNYIHDTGELVGHGAGIQLIQSGKNIISHNRIDKTPRYSISLKSYRLKKNISESKRKRDNVLYTGYNRDNIIEFNDISRANYDSQDTGAIEIWGGSAGNIIRNNHIHDCNIYLSFGFAIYLDDCADFCRVEKNLIEGLQKEGKGRLLYPLYVKGIEDVIINNIIADNNVFRAALGTFEMNNPNRNLESRKNIFYNSGDIYYFQNWGDDRFAISDYNLFYNKDQNYNILNEIRYEEDQYKEMGGVEDIEWNEISLDDWKNMYNCKFDNNSLVSDPLFINPEEGDYRLRYDSPAYQLGFEDIDYVNVGLKDHFKYRNESDQIARVFAGVEGQEFKGHIYLEIGQELQLSVKARTASGYLADLSDAKFIYKSNIPEVVEIDKYGMLTSYKSGVSRVKVSVIKAGVKKSVVFDVIVN